MSFFTCFARATIPQRCTCRAVATATAATATATADTAAAIGRVHIPDSANSGSFSGLLASIWRRRVGANDEAETDVCTEDE